MFFETAGWDGRQHIPMTIVECRTCGLRFTCPSFKEEFLDLVYPPDVIHKPEKVRKSFDINGRKANAILYAGFAQIKRVGQRADSGAKAEEVMKRSLARLS